MAISIKTLPNLSRCCLTIDHQVTPQSTKRCGSWVDSLSVGVFFPCPTNTPRRVCWGTCEWACVLESDQNTIDTKRQAKRQLAWCVVGRLKCCGDRLLCDLCSVTTHISTALLRGGGYKYSFIATSNTTLGPINPNDSNYQDWSASQGRLQSQWCLQRSVPPQKVR